MSERPKLPETKEVASWSDFSAAFATIERGEDGAVYFVTWWYGTPTVRCIVFPDGTAWTEDALSESTPSPEK